MDMYSSVLSVAKATMFVDQIFTKFDTDNDGSIDFKVGQPSVRKTSHLHQNMRETFIWKYNGLVHYRTSSFKYPHYAIKDNALQETQCPSPVEVTETMKGWLSVWW